MFCSKCGNRLEKNVLFCPSCGEKIGAIPCADHMNSATGTVVQRQKSRSSYGVPLLVNGGIAIVCGLIAMCLEATTQTNGVLVSIEEKFIGYSEYKVLVDTMRMATDICKLWIGIGGIFIIAGIILSKRKSNKKNTPMQILLWTLPMIMTLLIAAFDIISIVNVVTY